ncbi:MAG: hypothetical protein Q7S55_04645 [Nanoarchaeota archaeon]|nr:hypothetical protein [Nanoarchaeota archaeon]
MEEWAAHKLLELGYDPEKSEEAKHENLIAISRGYLGGLVFFEGEIIARDKCRTIVRDDGGKVTITGSRTQSSHSLYADILEKTLEKDTVVDPRSGYFSSLYISPLNKRFKEEGVCLDFICPQDRIYVDGVRNNTFILVVEDIRKKSIASFEFWTKGEMLYVPKQVNP